MQKFLRALLPAAWFRALERDTRKWLIECSCGHKRDLWAIGGVRYKARGEPRHRGGCDACGETTWHTVRKKTEEEAATL